MIPAADIEDQELSIRPESPGINYPTVGWCCDLGARARCNGKPSFRPAITVGSAKFLQFDPVNRNWNLPAQWGESPRGRQPSGIAKPRKPWAAVGSGCLTR